MSSAKNGMIHYQRSGSGVPLVLIHGVGANLGSWDGVCASLGSGFDVLRLDLRGHGESEHIEAVGAFSIDDFAEDVIAVMDSEGFDRAHVVGFSLGGLIVQRLAQRWSDRFDHVVILSAVAGRTPDERQRVLSRLDAIREGGIAAITGAATDRWFTEEFARTNPSVVENRIRELELNHLPSYLEAYRVFGQTELVDSLHLIPNPVLVMTGELDQGSNVRMATTIAQRIPNAVLKILPGLKHSVLAEAPGLIAGCIKAFITPTNRTTKMTSALFDKGLAQRKSTLGAEYVEKSLNNATDFSRDFQRLVTEYCWGEAWGDPTLPAKTRSMLNLTMIAALNRMHEWELHFKGALRNEVTLDELRSIITQITIYCGVPVGVECHRIANRVLAEEGLV